MRGVNPLFLVASVYCEGYLQFFLPQNYYLHFQEGKTSQTLSGLGLRKGFQTIDEVQCEFSILSIYLLTAYYDTKLTYD